MNDNVTIIKDIYDSIEAVIKEYEINLSGKKNTFKILIDLVSKIPDFRKPFLVKYKLSDIILASLILIMKDEFKSFVHAATYLEVFKDEFQKYGLFIDGNTPSHDTIRRVFMLLDAQNLKEKIIDNINTVLQKIIEIYKENNKKELCSIDGKEFKGSGRSKYTNNPRRNINVLNYYNASRSICLSSLVLDDKEGEVIAGQAMLQKFNLSNVIVTADALHCQRRTCEIIKNKKGNYVFTVKRNQENLYNEIIAKMTKEKHKIRHVDFNNCEYDILNLSSSYAGEDFPGQASYVKMVSHKREKQPTDKITELYFITSLKSTDAIVQSIDNRWKIENDFHKEKDYSFSEDDYIFTDKNAIRVMATMNNIVYAFFVLSSRFIPGSTPSLVRIRFKKNPIEVLEETAPLLSRKEFNQLLKANLKGRKKS